MSIGHFLESLGQAILVGIILVGRLGVVPSRLTDSVCRASSLSFWISSLATWAPAEARDSLFVCVCLCYIVSVFCVVLLIV